MTAQTQPLTRLEINGWLKIAEIDDYENGCQPDTAFMVDVDVNFHGATLEDLLEKVTGFFGVPLSEVAISACEEPGRLDVTLLENKDGIAASQAEIERWRKGHLTLWDVTYTAQVETVTRQTLPLKFAS